MAADQPRDSKERRQWTIMNMRTGSAIALSVGLLLAYGAQNSPNAQNRDVFGTLPRDTSKPVATKAQIIAAWQRRQDGIKSASFAWVEQQTYPNGWLGNPRFPERERAAIPALREDRTYLVSKTLAVDGNKMRYSFELDRKEKPDGVRVQTPDNRTDGLGLRRKYRYLSVFDGQVGKTRLTSLLDSPPQSPGR